MLLALTTMLLLAADAPVAVTPPSATDMTGKVTLMESHVRGYLEAERSESRLFVALGVIALGAGAFFLTRSDPFLRGAAFPLMAIALIQIGVGGSVWWRTESQIAQLVSLINADAAKFVADETVRMAAVNRNFDVYKIAEMVLAVVGLGMVAGGYALGGSRLVMGVGAGLALQSAVMLTLDLFAEARADKYTDQVVLFGKAR